jgi:hypothetical protein
MWDSYDIDSHLTLNGWKNGTCYCFGNPPLLTHTDSIENLRSLFEVGVAAQFHKVSAKHRRRYLDDFTCRFNGWGDTELFQNTLRSLVNGNVLPFEKLTKAA